jgi:Domain of unknown function (DUF222)
MAWARMAALAEFASRPRRPDFAADEIASAFRLTWLSAAAEIDFARTVKRRLPVTFAALGAGKLHPVHVKIIEEVTSVLSDEDAAIADAVLATAGPSKTVPHTALGGDSGPPGEVAGFGITDHADTRDLIAAAAGHPATRWCVTVLNPDGTAAAHGCAAGPRRWPPGQGPPGQGPPGPMPVRGLLDFLTIRKLTPVIRGPCQHAAAEHRYRPSRKLQHLVRARNATCTAPGCGRRAASCDLDHTHPRHEGGRTCECNLAPLCRHHHRCKQAEGWRLEQPEPGVLVWHTPAGRSYTTTPTPYAS